MMKTSPASPRRAFSLLELLAVVTIIGILAGIIVPRASVSSHNAAVKTCSHNRAQLNSALELYNLENGSFPADLATLEPTHFPSGIPTCPVSGNAYQLDVAGERIDSHVGETHP
ncbi:competence type IV pilus major pilin ComGC [Adhaeretor mobilis]|uniref:Type II secretion system protein G n=1 Tax=Adhaeretor mobilis TaxID=1930276 RepID=A0A517MWU3_9BACT|nr:prepilin-type N-terminal cleavage/methylation domain-containing protein [Adhaeretor mobilis]QDS99350.1 Type II secretion system protein G precursor [Adhaeretor mobilis]